MRKYFLLPILALALCPSGARAQFIGYTSPQTVQQTLANNVACTGSAQNFLVNNLGQTQHYISFVNTGPTMTTLQAEIDGIDVQGNVFRISDILSVISSVTPGLLSGSGYFPIIRVKVTCTAGNYVLAYAGASSVFNQTTGSYQVAQLNKTIFNAFSATASPSVSFQTPFGSSLGMLEFSYSNPVAGGTITIQCTDFGGLVTGPQTTFTLANVGTAQPLPMSAAVCPFTAISYSPGGGATGTINLNYNFSTPGSPTNIPSLATPTQSPQIFNSESTAVNASVTKTIVGTPAGRTHLYSVSARCSAGTAGITVTDTGTIWSSGTAEVGTTTFKFQWNPGLAGSFNTNMVITLTTCGAANTGTLDVQASQF
jgi:hypothetical protein